MFSLKELIFLVIALSVACSAAVVYMTERHAKRNCESTGYAVLNGKLFECRGVK